MSVEECHPLRVGASKFRILIAEFLIIVYMWNYSQLFSVCSTELRPAAEERIRFVWRGGAPRV